MCIRDRVAFNLGNALGAYFGGLPMDHGLSYRYATLPGAGFALLGFLMLVVYCRKYPRRRDPAAQEVSAG